MSLIRPFRALRPVNERISQVASVPYDVISQNEARKVAQDNPWSFLHVSRSEIDLPIGTNPYIDEVYRRASINFEQLIRNCPFLQEDEPSLYLYRLRMEEHEQTGLVGCFSIDEYDSSLIKKHERTQKVKEDDRTRHVLELSAQTGPVLLTYHDVLEINNQVNQAKLSAPLYDFVTSDGVRHTLWHVLNPKTFVTLFADRVSTLYIADGHHRAAAASRARTQLASHNPAHTGAEDYNFVLAVAFPNTQLKILPYHRIVKDLWNMSDAQFLEKVGTAFRITPQRHVALPNYGEFGMYLKGQWYQLHPKNLPVRKELDVTVLQDSLLEPILGIFDPRTDKRINFVGGLRGIADIENEVDSRDAVVGFLLHPPQLQDVIEIADRGGVMPPKSTWFEPKLRDGLFCYSLK